MHYASTKGTLLQFMINHSWKLNVYVYVPINDYTRYECSLYFLEILNLYCASTLIVFKIFDNAYKVLA